MKELMFVAGENREIVEAYVDRMYDDAQVNSKWTDFPTWIGFRKFTMRASMKLKKTKYGERLDLHSRIVSS